MLHTKYLSRRAHALIEEEFLIISFVAMVTRVLHWIEIFGQYWERNIQGTVLWSLVESDRTIKRCHLSKTLRIANTSKYKSESKYLETVFGYNNCMKHLKELMFRYIEAWLYGKSIYDFKYEGCSLYIVTCIIKHEPSVRF